MFKSKLDKRIQEERLGTLVQNLPSSIISTMAVSSFIFYLIYDKVNTQLALVWLIVIFALSLFRSAHIYKINRRTDTSLLQEERFILIGIFLSGITFGASIVILFPHNDFSVQVLLFFLISAMIAGSVALYSMHILAFVAYSVPLIIAFTYQTLIMNDLALILFLIGSVYYAIMLMTMIRVNKSILRSLKTQYLNQDLAFNLSQAKEELERSNNELTEENRVREETEKRLNRLANYDPLTGLANRLMFKEELRQSLKTAINKGSRMAIMFLDLDNFKIINDTLGHAMGDKLLIAASSRLKSLLDRHSSIARLGGDEFVIIINEAKDDAKIALLADEIIELLELPFIFDENEMFIGTSIGISLYPDHSDMAETLLSYADTAMYTAKDKGKNNYQFFTPAMHKKILFRHDIETRLHHAMQNNEFRIRYQPKIDLNTDTVIGAEALLRWEHKELGKIPPSVFIPIAEESSLINLVGKWVIKTVCRDLSRIKHDFGNDISISINISSSQILHQNLPELIQENLDTYDLPTKAIELEFTESMLIKQGRKSQQVLDRLSKMGVKLCIDDFGTGYSSLNYLKTLPIHTLKIDKSFICDTPKHESDCAIAKSIISLASNLNLDVIAEGVETAEQLTFLKENGCSVIQGFYFSKPLDFSAFTAYLNAPSLKKEQTILS